MMKVMTEEEASIFAPMSIVAFFDILGYKARISEIKSSIDIVRETILLMKVIYNVNGLFNKSDNTSESAEERNDPSPWHYTQFSDCFVLNCPISGDGELSVGGTLLLVAEAQRELVLNGYFVRGGVDIGNIWTDTRMLIGPAVIHAYDLENKLAVYPRIILSKNVLKIIKNKYLPYYGKTEDSPFNVELAFDEDGHLFLNYLFVNADDWDYSETLKIHKEVVQNNLERNSDNEKIYRKYQWAASYHNWFCSQFENKFQELLISDCKITNQFRRLDQVWDDKNL